MLSVFLRFTDSEYLQILLGVKPLLLSQTSSYSEMMRTCKRFLHVIKMSFLIYNCVRSVVLKNALILHFIHNIFNLRDIEVVTCIILVL